MKQIFILGASSVYGVGAERGGWADLVKAYIHSKLYVAGGPGEACEVFNFAKAGSTVEFVADTFPWLCQNYQRDGAQLITLISVGGNDSKARGTPRNYVCTPEAFREKITHLCSALQARSSHVIFVGNGYVDEAKVSPKTSPFGDGSVSYFTNERRSQFNATTKEVCQSMGCDFVAADCDKETWVSKYLYRDGLHPNQAGYELVFETLKPKLDTAMQKD